MYVLNLKKVISCFWTESFKWTTWMNQFTPNHSTIYVSAFTLKFSLKNILKCIKIKFKSEWKKFICVCNLRYVISCLCVEWTIQMNQFFYKKKWLFIYKSPIYSDLNWNINCNTVFFNTDRLFLDQFIYMNHLNDSVDSLIMVLLNYAHLS